MPDQLEPPAPQAGELGFHPDSGLSDVREELPGKQGVRKITKILQPGMCQPGPGGGEEKKQ